MAEPTLFIAGLGRCGTTMVMRMLDHGGIPVAGPRPAYEVDHMRPGRVDTAWVAAQAGRAVKWVDPVNARIPFGQFPKGKLGFLLLRRDPEHQARSMCKMAGHHPTKGSVAALADSIRHDNAMVERYLKPVGDVFSATFEWAIREPDQMAQKLAAICREVLGRDLNVSAAAAAVIHRRPYCAPDMAIETQLLAEVQHGRHDQ